MGVRVHKGVQVRALTEEFVVVLTEEGWCCR
jgi:hypothetical protein